MMPISHHYVTPALIDTLRRRSLSIRQLMPLYAFHDTPLLTLFRRFAAMRYAKSYCYALLLRRVIAVYKDAFDYCRFCYSALMALC